MSEHGGGLLGKIGGGLGSLFGGRTDPRLSEEQNQAARSDALITSGLATILAPGSGGFAATGLQAIATGALAGREQGDVSREDLLVLNQQKRIQEIVDSGDATPEVLQSLFMQAIANGDTDSARALAEVLKTMNTASGIRPIMRSMADPARPGQNMDFLVDPFTGERTAVGASAVTKSSARRPTFNVEEPGGRTALYFLNDDGSSEFIRYVSPKDSPSRLERTDIGLADIARNTNEGLERIDAEFTKFLPQMAARGPAFVKQGANWALSSNWSPFQSDDAQEAVAEALMFINAAVRYLSGQQMTEQEFNRYFTALIPQTFEGAAGVAIKKKMRAGMVQAMGQGRWEAIQNPDGSWTFADVLETLDTLEREARGITDETSASDILRRGVVVP